MLTQKEIIEAVSSRVNIAPVTIRDTISALIDIIADQISAEKDCRIHGLGTFKTVQSQKRIGRNPASGDAMKIPTKVRVRFRPGFRLKESANKATQVLKLHDIAKLMVSELLLYNSNEIDRGIREGNVYQVLDTKLKDARENFVSRIPDGVKADISIFEEAFKRFIEKRKKAIESMK